MRTNDGRTGVAKLRQPSAPLRRLYSPYKIGSNATALRPIGMESTGVYWKPVYYLLEDTFDCWLLIITRDTCTMCRAARPMSPTPRGLHSSSNMAWCVQSSFHRGEFAHYTTLRAIVRHSDRKRV